MSERFFNMITKGFYITVVAGRDETDARRRLAAEWPKLHHRKQLYDEWVQAGAVLEEIAPRVAQPEAA